MFSWQVGSICQQIADVFGFSGAGAVRETLEDAGFVLTPRVAAQLLQLHGRRRVREPLVFSGNTGVGKSFLLELYALLVNRDPAVVFSGRVHLISVLRAAGRRHGRQPSAAAVGVAPGAGGGAVGAAAAVPASPSGPGLPEAAPSVHAAKWRELLGDLPLTATAAEVVGAVREVVALDPAPHAAELGRAIAAYFSVLTAAFPLMRDGAGEALGRLIDGVESLRPTPQGQAAFTTAEKADRYVSLARETTPAWWQRLSLYYVITPSFRNTPPSLLAWHICLAASLGSPRRVPAERIHLGAVLHAGYANANDAAAATATVASEAVSGAADGGGGGSDSEDDGGGGGSGGGGSGGGGSGGGGNGGGGNGGDSTLRADLQRLKDAERAEKRAKWAAAAAGTLLPPRPSAAPLPAWREVDRGASLEEVLHDAIRMQPRGLYRRHVMHEGIGYREWAALVREAAAEAERLEKLHSPATLVVFVDELNTAGALGAVCETVSSHTLDGVALPRNILFCGALNPPDVGAFDACAFDAGAADGAPAGQQQLQPPRGPRADDHLDFRWAAQARLGAMAHGDGGGGGGGGGALGEPPRGPPGGGLQRQASWDRATRPREDESREEYMPAFVVKAVPGCVAPLLATHEGLGRKNDELMTFLRELMRGRQVRVFVAQMGQCCK